MNWNQRCKIALASQNEKQLIKLLESMPNDGSLEELESRKYLLHAMHTFFTEKKQLTSNDLHTLKKQINFIEQQSQSPQHRVDIRL